MKNIHIIASISVLFILLLSSLNFKYQEADQSLRTVKENFHDGLNAFETSIANFQQIANHFDATSTSIEKLQKAHLNNRLAFKNIELFLEYYERFAIVKHINGAPLPKTEPAVAEVLIAKPTGLQVLDELVFSDNPFAEKKEIKKHADKLAGVYQEIKRHQKQVSMTHRHIFEAARQELVRIFTLGLTGFDTPGSVNAIPEAVQAVKSVANAINAYQPLIATNKLALSHQIDDLFKEAVTYLETHDDFDTFDRLHFLKTYINPLYSITYQAHRATGVETIDEVSQKPLPFNYHVTGIFDDDFMNAAYFAELDLHNPLNDKRAALGKLLFFDTVLSSTNERSCASCHQPEKAFTDGQKTSLATGEKGNILRNAPTVINSVYAEKYFYDLRVFDLEKQTKHVIFDDKEFATDFATITKKLKQSKEYNNLFLEAYSDYPQYALTPATLTNALACYIASLRSFNSPFDQYVRNERDDLSPSAKNGFNLFMGKAACGTCHFAPTFNGTVPPIYEESESEILGVPATTENKTLDGDVGRRGNRIPRDEAPFYMHSFKTLRTVTVL
ncbi:MAG: cytochrome-c peroxidase, partial [Bacteroidota bacterium]